MFNKQINSIKKYLSWFVDANGIGVGFSNSRTKYELLEKFVDAYTENLSPELLVFGDSVSIRYANDEKCRLTFDGILSRRFNGKNKFLIVSGSGYHSALYEQYCRLLSKLSGRPKVVVMPINLRSFSPTWDLDPLYQYSEQVNLIKTFDLSNKSYDLPFSPVSAASAHNDGVIAMQGVPIDTLNEFKDIAAKSPAYATKEWFDRLEMLFRCHYMYSIDMQHRKIKSYGCALQELGKLKIPVFLYFTPINYESGVEFCGEEFVDVAKEMISKIENELRCAYVRSRSDNNEDQITIDNYAFNFSKRIFFTNHNATEHLRYDGRLFIVEKIIEYANKYYFETHAK